MAAKPHEAGAPRTNAIRRPAWPALPASLWLALVTVLCLLPFVDRAFHVDDPLFVWAGDHIRGDPLDFYGFDVNWTLMTDARMHQVTKNPPLVPYFIALVRALFGESEAVLHLAFLLPAVAVVLGTYRLARAHSARPGIAALATLFTPVFLVSAVSVMSDVSMLACWVWSVVLWDRGLRGAGTVSLAGGALLAGLAFLAKYYGIALVPLLLVYGLALRRRPGGWALWLLLPLGVVLLYEALTLALYGHGLFLDAIVFAARQGAGVPRRWLAAGVTGLVFLGGCLLGTVCLGPWLLPKPLWWGGCAVAAGAVAAVLLDGARAGPDAAIAAQRALFLAVGIFVLLLLLAELVHRPEPVTWLLALWVGGTLCFATWANWVVNGRSILPIAPAVGLLLARRLDARYGEAGRRVAWALLPAAGIALAVTWADEQQANAERRAAREVAALHGGGASPLWCAATWGFKYYLERSGAQLVDASGTRLGAGDTLVSPAKLWREPALREGLVRVDQVEVQPPRWLATMDRSVGAGFYAASYARRRGPLPFALGRVPPRRFYVMRVTRPLLYREVPVRSAARARAERDASR